MGPTGGRVRLNLQRVEVIWFRGESPGALDGYLRKRIGEFSGIVANAVQRQKGCVLGQLRLT
jgi:hypothetical protein